MVTVLRTPARPMLVRPATCHMELSMKNLIARFVKAESGATAIEYGLIAAGISLAIIAIVNGLGSNLNTKFTNINGSLKEVSVSFSGQQGNSIRLSPRRIALGGGLFFCE